MTKKKSILSHEVMYVETDMMGIVHHSNYIIWMEKGRIDLLRLVGVDIREYEKAGFYLPVVEVWSRYKKPALFGDKLTIETYLKKRERSLVTFRSTISCNGQVLNIGEVKCTIINQDKKIVEVLPEPLEEALATLTAEE